MNAKRPDPTGFVECANCSKKPGTSMLCPNCSDRLQDYLEAMAASCVRKHSAENSSRAVYDDFNRQTYIQQLRDGIANLGGLEKLVKVNPRLAMQLREHGGFPPQSLPPQSLPPLSKPTETWQEFQKRMEDAGWAFELTTIARFKLNPDGSISRIE